MAVIEVRRHIGVHIASIGQLAIWNPVPVADGDAIVLWTLVANLWQKRIAGF